LKPFSLVDPLGSHELLKKKRSKKSLNKRNLILSFTVEATLSEINLFSAPLARMFLVKLV